MGILGRHRPDLFCSLRKSDWKSCSSNGSARLQRRTARDRPGHSTAGGAAPEDWISAGELAMLKRSSFHHADWHHGATIHNTKTMKIFTMKE